MLERSFEMRFEESYGYHWTEVSVFEGLKNLVLRWNNSKCNNNPTNLINVHKRLTVTSSFTKISSNA